jgi:hypothetical protein
MELYTLINGAYSGDLLQEPVAMYIRGGFENTTLKNRNLHEERKYGLCGTDVEITMR